MRSEMSRFTGDIGREEEDGLGWDGLVESGREKRERETYDGLVRDAMLWRKRQIAATDTRKIIEETLESISCISCDFRIGGSCFLCHICRKHLADALCAALEGK